MKFLLSFFLIAMGLATKAQANNLYPYINGDTLMTKTGYPIIVGQKIKIGTGTRLSGGFEYITEASIVNINRFFYKNQDDASNENKITSVLTGEDAKVIELKRTGKKGKKAKYDVKIKCGLTKYWCDIENAIKVKEITIPDKFMAARPN